MYVPKLGDIRKAATGLKGLIDVTPFQKSLTYSKLFDAEVYFKREDLQLTRSYKIRGAFNKISSLTKEQKVKGIVCASAGNHAQGVALSCEKLQIKGTIFMPATTPKQKIEQVLMFGGGFVEITLKGDTFDDSYKIAIIYCKAHEKAFVHPFDDEKIIEGQATVGLEILEQTSKPLDYLFLPVGGGGLSSGVASIFHNRSPKTKLIGVEPKGAPSMTTAIKNNKNTALDSIDKFIDGAAVRRVGDLTFDICRKYLYDMITVPEGKVCQTLLDLYNKDAMVVEPAGVLSVAALYGLQSQIKGKSIACIISGGNNDIMRTPEIKERALLYNNTKHYFIITFPQRAGALREFVIDILGPTDDITYFEYQKKHNKENGPAIVGIVLKSPKDLDPLINRMKDKSFFGEHLNKKSDLLSLLI